MIEFQIIATTDGDDDTEAATALLANAQSDALTIRRWTKDDAGEWFQAYVTARDVWDDVPGTFSKKRAELIFRGETLTALRCLNELSNIAFVRMLRVETPFIDPGTFA